MGRPPVDGAVGALRYRCLRPAVGWLASPAPASGPLSLNLLALSLLRRYYIKRFSG